MLPPASGCMSGGLLLFKGDVGDKGGFRRFRVYGSKLLKGWQYRRLDQGTLQGLLSGIPGV